MAKKKEKPPRNPGRVRGAAISIYEDFRKKILPDRNEVDFDEATGLLEVKDAAGNVIASAQGARPSGRTPYNEQTANDICTKFACGERLLDFLGTGKFPSWYTYNYWRVKYPEFNQRMKEAAVIRAEAHVAELEHVSDTVNPGNSKAAKVRADVLKHLAAVRDPETFGHRTKVVGDRNAPIAFTVVTGVPLPEGDDGRVPATRSEPKPELPALPGGEIVLDAGSAGSESAGDAGGAVDPDPLPEQPGGLGDDREKDQGTEG